MDADWSHYLILQFPGSDLKDFDHLVAFEELLSNGLGTKAEVDGHDFGSGEGNIFLYTNDPELVFRRSRELLPGAVLEGMRAAYRQVYGETYTILWPPDLKEFRIA